MATTRLSRTAGTPTLNTKHTISMWLKRSKLSYGDCFLIDGYQDGNNRFKLSFDASDRLECYNTHGGSYKYNVVTNRKFRDVSAFYHLVVRIDTTQASASNRVRIYVNGTEEESFSTYTDATQDDANNVVNESGATISIGDYQGGSNAFEGIMSHVHFVDGTSYAASTFGSTDSTTGEWQINTSPSITMGTNGFTILKDGNTITDQSSNSNNFTLVAGTLTKTEDCPSNVFAAFNPLDNYFPAGTYKNGNTTVNTGNNYAYPQATIYVNKGKWYWEVKAISKVSGGDEYMIGIQGRSATAVNQPAQANHGITVYGTDGDTYGFGGGATTYAAAYTAGDIVGVALDCDNNKLYFSKNGAWSTGSGAWGSTTFNSSTGALTITDPNDVPQGGYSPVAGAYTSVSHEMSYNFGNGYFGTTAVSSAGTNASGIGIFEYNVPTGYTSLSTKGLNL